MSEAVDAVFGPTGLLSEAFDGYQPRDGQIAMTEVFERAFETGTHAAVHAPCGVGKSLGYISSAVNHSSVDSRTIIVTNSILLQEQLVKKDLPFMVELMDGPSFALAKGISNYVCKDRLAAEEKRGTLNLAEDASEAAALRAFIDWSRKTATGDRSELAVEPPERLWGRFSVSSGECAGKECPMAETCYGRRARAEFKRAAIVVTNYHMFFLDLAVREKSGGQSNILGMYDRVIFDEAHEANGVARDVYGARISAGMMFRLSSHLKHYGMDRQRGEFEAVVRTFFDDLATYRASGRYKIRLRTPGEVDGQPLSDALRVVAKHLADLAERNKDRAAVLAQASRRAKELAQEVDDTTLLREPGAVSFIAEEAKGRLVLSQRYVDVSELLRKMLFEVERHDADGEPLDPPAVVMTSATLAVEGKFDYLSRQLGVTFGETLCVESPFNFQENCLLVVPEGVAPTEPTYHDYVAQRVCEAVTEAGGRTLALFTSYKALDTAHRALLAMGGHRILRQGEAPRSRLVAEFRNDVGSVLLGTSSFWQGIDVPGEALSVVVIDRLPFATPDDPVMDAIKATDRNFFANHSIPEAVLQLVQGFGRLIRSVSDYGVVVCLDRRMVEATYSERFLSSLPRTYRRRDMRAIGRFLEFKRGAAKVA